VVVNPVNNKVYVMQLGLGSPNSLAVLNAATLVLRPLDGQAGTPLFDAQAAAGEQWGRVEVIRVHPGLNRVFVGMTNTAGVTRIVAINSADDSVVGTWIGARATSRLPATDRQRATTAYRPGLPEWHAHDARRRSTLAVIGTNECAPACGAGVQCRRESGVCPAALTRR
jgi:hypothetical protein